MQMQVNLLLLFLLLDTSSADGDLCTKCACLEKSPIQPLYTIDCSFRSLTEAYGELQQWPEFTRHEDSRVAVNLDFNDISHLKKFKKIPGIVSLSVRHNKMTQIAGKAFIDLHNLKTLDLSYNLLSGDGVNAGVFLGQYSSENYNPLGIVVLNLGHNQIQALSEYTFEHLPNLTEVRLDNNPLKSIDSSTLKALEAPNQLQVLDLSYTQISELPEDFVLLYSIRHKLQVLYLNGNQFTEVPEDLAALGDSLQKLNLNDNPIVELDENSFRGLLKLRELNVSAMPYLERIGPATFGHLESLEILYCSFNKKLTNVDQDAFEFGKTDWTLKELHLRSNALQSLPKLLAPWKELAIIDVQDNPWHCDCEIEWIVDELVPILENTTPDLALELHCSEPLWLSGMSILNFRSQSLCEKMERPPSEPRRSAPAGKYVIFKSIGIVLMISVGGVVLALYFVKQRRRNMSISLQMLISPNVRYIKTINNDI